MADYTVSFYDADPDKIFSNKVGDTSVYNGPARTFGEAVITDNGLSTAGQSLEHKDKGEDAVASISIGDITEENILVYAERSWTLYDTVTGETFEMVRFRVKDGSHTGDYTLSERELVAGRTYETRAYSSKPDAEVGDPVFTYDDYLPETDLVVPAPTVTMSLTPIIRAILTATGWISMTERGHATWRGPRSTGAPSVMKPT